MKCKKLTAEAAGILWELITAEMARGGRIEAR
jgi:hypothetical protein